MSTRIAEEAQLLAEEKWIIEALTKIRLQRNCLQIERLHLESLKSKLVQKSNDKNGAKENPQTEVAETPTASTSASTPIIRSSRKSIEFEDPLITEDSCNIEPLNLAVTKSVFNQDYPMENMEEYEEEDDPCDNIFIDMNMLMNSNRSAETA